MLAQDASTRPMSLTMRLSDLGISSIQMVGLMLGVEAEFNLVIPPNEITPENFLSIASIATLVDRLCPNPAR
jgi:acyl carrier protein